jgi:hypothetical protein
MSIELQQTFELLKKLKPGLVSISVGGITSASGDAEVEFINEDPDLPENDPNETIIECFGYDAEVNVIDAGIGAYEFWGAKGVDSHMQNEVQSLEMTDTWPDELKWLEDIIAEKICDAISELDPDNNEDYYD